jgi:hypothetical protein
LALWWAQAAQQEPLTVAWLQQAEVAAGSPDVPVLPQAGSASASVRAVAALLPEEGAAVSVHAAAEPRPEAASGPSGQQAAAGAA